VRAEFVIDFNGVITANNNRSPQSSKFVCPRVRAFLHLELDVMVKFGEQADVFSFIESRGEQSVSRLILEEIGSIELNDGVRISHDKTSDAIC
jgi:hypothetical protein